MSNKVNNVNGEIKSALIEHQPMTLEERIAKIENALIAANLMDPSPRAISFQDAMADFHKGDNTALKKYFLQHPPHLEPAPRGRSSKKSPSRGCDRQ